MCVFGRIWALFTTVEIYVLTLPVKRIAADVCLLFTCCLTSLDWEACTGPPWHYLLLPAPTTTSRERKHRLSQNCHCNLFGFHGDDAIGRTTPHLSLPPLLYTTVYYCTLLYTTVHYWALLGTTAHYCKYGGWPCSQSLVSLYWWRHDIRFVYLAVCFIFALPVQYVPAKIERHGNRRSSFT